MVAGDDSTDDEITSHGVSRELLSKMKRAGSGADENYPIRKPTVAPLDQKPLPPHPPRRQESEQSKRERRDQVTTREIDVEKVSNNRNAAKEAETGNEHALVFGSICSDDARIATTNKLQGQGPTDNEDYRNDGICVRETCDSSADNCRPVKSEPNELRPAHSPGNGKQVGQHQAAAVSTSPVRNVLPSARGG